MQHRNFLKITAYAIVALAPLFAPSLAQTYPIKPIRLVVPFPPAGATDILGRTLAQKLTEVLGQSVIVDNKPGAGGAIGSDIVAKSVADGYTILIASSSTHSVGPALNSKMPYHPIKDFSPIVHLGDVTSVLVVPMSLPVKSVQELVAMAKAKPGSLNFGSRSEERRVGKEC